MPNRQLIARIAVVALTALAMFVAGAGTAAAALPATHSFSRQLDAPADGTVDLASAQLRQDGAALGLSVELGSGRAGIAAGSRVCASLAGVQTSHLCFVRSAAGWRATVDGTTANAVVALPGQRSLSVEVPLVTLGLKPGALRWSVTATAAHCASGDRPCVDRLPASGTVRSRLWTPVATGCSNPGARLVTQGPAGKKIALTFDDGPSPYTPQILAVLERAKIPATFFMIGRQVAGHGADLKRELADGDELADHSWNHANLGGGGPEATSQLVSTNQAIRAASGFEPCLFRPPYGATGSDLVARAGALGMTTVTWNVDPSDWATPGTGAIVNTILAQTRPGSIILDHDGGGPRGQTVAAVPTVIATLKSRGYQFVTVSELLGQSITYGLRS